ncbi:putative beta-glucosidase btgE [Lachnellula arida]|uniref:Probable beta-glucosidase btgE n=1 Tax=Lachnellula arida TaxID=1316785 RepID=A0A8T9B8L4_9HELO|nr:putative beta-glucosidase btgE [Lachnellula arida]
MKSAVFAIAAAAIATGVSAGKGHHARRHGHDAFHQKMPRELASGYSVTGTSPPPRDTCGYTTIYTTVTREAGVYYPPAPTGTLSSMALAPPPPSALSSSSTSVPITSSSSSTSKLVKSSSSNSSTAVLTTSTILTTITSTTISCASTVTNCPAHSTALVTLTKVVGTTVCPVTATETGKSGVSVPATASVPGASLASSAGGALGSSKPAVSVVGSATSSTPSSTITVASSTSTIANVPTPLATTCPTPGVYTIPATTVTLTESTTVCGAASATVTPGTNTVGGVTTIVSTATTIVCPYATASTNSGVVTNTILTTTYVCPSAGTYTIAPITTSVSSGSICVFPTPASYAPGTYTQPQVVTTITATNVVVFCPFTSSASAPSTSSVAPPPVTTSSVAAPVTTSSVSVAPSAGTSSVLLAPPVSFTAQAQSSAAATSSVLLAPPVSFTAQAQSSAAASSSAPKSSSSGSSSGLSVGTSGDRWAMTYTPYSPSGGGCLSEAQVAIDVASIKAAGFTAIRLYSTDCSSLDFIGKAAELAGLKLIVGVFISTTGISAAEEQVNDIVSWAQWDLVELIVIGNEAVFNKYCTAQELADFISSSKSKFSGAGYTGQCTTTEPLNVWQENGFADLLCPLVDVTGANIHPFFNTAITSDQAGSFVASQLQIVDNLCAGKSGINLECGWPSSGQCNGQACPGEDHQTTALTAITKAAGGKTAFFSFTNDLWKTPGDLDCEQFWGSINVFANLEISL